MESINTKRKLKRTRRNLNEIRKRAYQINNSTFNTRFKTNVGVDKKRDPFKSSIFITSNRLTLLNKTVTSKTVTRSFVYKTECSDGNTYLVNTQCQLKCDNNEDCNSDKIDRKTKGSVSNGVHLFRPLKRINSDSSDTDQNNSFRYSVKSDSLSSELQSDYGEHGYVRFMNDIPKYIYQTAPILLKTDTVEKKIESLRKLYLEFDNNQNYEQITKKYEFTNDFNSSTMENIIENPISYLGCSYPKSEIVDIKDDESSTANSFSSLITCPSPITLYTIDCDSPEYPYYPHKLNE
ncbi:unnamed protein product, partial [Brenthis ino]